jgi:hypothetical protein
MEMSVMETVAENIIEKIESSYNSIIRLYRSVPVSAVIEPGLPNGWSVKDTLAHIAAWEWRCASLLDASHDTDAPLDAEPDVEALNLEIYQERKDWSWEDVEHDFRGAHRGLLEAIRQLPAERLNYDFVQQSIATETWEHYAEHLPDLERWHKRVISNK